MYVGNDMLLQWREQRFSCSFTRIFSWIIGSTRQMYNASLNALGHTMCVCNKFNCASFYNSVNEKEREREKMWNGKWEWIEWMCELRSYRHIKRKTHSHEMHVYIKMYSFGWQQWQRVDGWSARLLWRHKIILGLCEWWIVFNAFSARRKCLIWQWYYSLCNPR